MDAAIFALVGVVIAQTVAVVVALSVGRRDRREQHLGMLRWAAELAAEDDAKRRRLGLAQLEALAETIPARDRVAQRATWAATEVLVDARESAVIEARRAVDPALDADDNGREPSR